MRQKKLLGEEPKIQYFKKNQVKIELIINMHQNYYKQMNLTKQGRNLIVII